MESVISLILISAVLVIGVIICFAGLKYLKRIIAVYMFISGFLFVYNLMAESFPETGGAFAIALIAGLVLALLSAFFIKFCIFITGGLAGIFIFFTFVRTSPFMFAAAGGSSFLYGIIFFVVFGIIALIVKKHLVIIFTAYIGAETITQAAGMLIGAALNPRVLNGIALSNAVGVLRANSIFAHASAAAHIIPAVIFLIAGMLAQYKYTAKKARL